MSLSGWMFIGAGIAVAIAFLAAVWGWLTRRPKSEGEPVTIGDAALLDHPQLPRPPVKPMRREPEPMGM